MKEPMPDLITEVDKYEKGWSGGLPETPCGFGSKVEQTATQRRWLAEMVDKYQIKTVADIGAGDLNWIRHMQWQVEYQPYDLVPRETSVKPLDIIHEKPPAADLLLCLWLLNHLPEAHAAAAMDNLLSAGAKYLILTYEPRQWDCTDLRAIERVTIRDRGKGDPRGNVELRLIKC